MDLDWLKYKTKDNSTPGGKPRVYFTCHPDDFDPFFDAICQDIFRTQNCVIYYKSDQNLSLTEDEKESVLGQMNLIVTPVTDKFLSEENEARSEFQFAVEHQITKLPILCEKKLEDRFNIVCGNFQALDRTPSEDHTADPYGDKLKRMLSSVLTSDELAAEIRREFGIHVFISYRKKDRKQAQDLMRLIHQEDQNLDIAIWYDEFLVPGEDFNESIQEHMNKSDIVIFSITPRFLEKDNYIMKYEFPQAKDTGKPIIPAEMDPLDPEERESLHNDFPQMPEPVDAHDQDSFQDALSNELDQFGNRGNNNEPEHLLHIGQAYLNGIDVELDSACGFRLISRAAERGNAEAQYQLALCYEYGEGTDADDEKAVEWYEKAVEQGHIGAHVVLGCKFLDGAVVSLDPEKGTELLTFAAEHGDLYSQIRLGRFYEMEEPNDEKAAQWFEKAAEQGDADSQFEAGEYYRTGRGVEQDFAKAAEWYTRAAEQGHAESQYELACLYYSGLGVEQDFKKAAELWIQAAEQNIEGAREEIGNCYYNGEGVDQSFEKAVEWWRKGVGCEKAYQIAFYYYDGQGTKQNLKEAEYWFDYSTAEFVFYKYPEDISGSEMSGLYTGAALEQAEQHLSYDDFFAQDFEQICRSASAWYSGPAQKGDADAQYYLGLCYANAQGKDQDPVKAVECWRSAAEQGHIGAQMKLGECYMSGKGVDQDYGKAAEWYQKAAEQGNAAAQYYLGSWYDIGRGVEQNFEKAAEWYQRAAEHGNSRAQYELGLCYFQGHGVEQNYEKAVECWEKVESCYVSDVLENLADNAEAELGLGYCYANGLGVEQNDDIAMHYYYPYALEGESDASYFVGCHSTGKEAVYFWIRAAKCNHEGAQKALLNMCRESADNPKLYTPYLAGQCEELADFFAGKDDAESREKAEEFYRAVLKIRRKLAEKDPENCSRDLAVFCNNLALFLEERADEEDQRKAEHLYSESLEIWLRLAELDPAANENDLAITCENFALLLEQQDDDESQIRAEKLHNKALEIRRRLAAEDPDTYEENLADVCENLASFLERQDDPESLIRAEELYNEAMEIRQRRAEDDPDQE